MPVLASPPDSPPASRVPPARRAAVYALAGFASEVAYSAVHDRARGRRVRLRTSAWMLPVYAVIQPLYEPVHERLRERSPAVRAAVYGAGALAVEYASGRLLRAVLGRAPWDYTYARYHLHGLIRPEYALLWAAGGLALERLHDALVGVDRTATPPAHHDR